MFYHRLLHLSRHLRLPGQHQHLLLAFLLMRIGLNSKTNGSELIHRLLTKSGQGFSKGDPGFFDPAIKQGT
jgi:hypothetical protein